MEQNGTCSDRSWDSPIVIKAIPKDWDVFDYPSMDKFPEVGLEKTAYIDLEANSIYRWDKETEEYVAIGGGGGSSDYERLRHLPTVNGVTLVGNKTTEDLGIAEEISTAVGTEAQTRLEADENLQEQIDAITSASDVVDVVGTYAELEDYDTSKLNDNDIIKVLQDETRNNAITYYRWIEDDEAFTYIGSQGPFYTKSESNSLLNNKVDKVEGKGLSTEDFTTEEKEKLAGIEGQHPYLSLVRDSDYLYTVTFDKLPEEDDTVNSSLGGCTSFVRHGKLYRNLDWNYNENASFHVVMDGIEGMAFVNGLNADEMDDEKIAQLPYHLVDGVNKDGIMVSTHVIYNDWEWTGAGDIALNKLPLLVLENVKSMASISSDLSDILSDLYVPTAMAETGYVLQLLVTDGTTTYVIAPKLNSNDYVLINATNNPKLTNFYWVENNIVERNGSYMQDHPTGVERWNDIRYNPDLSYLRFTKAYEANTRLSEFIGIDGTDKNSSDNELKAIYNLAHAEYLERKRDGKLWQTMHSVVYSSKKGMEELYVQEDWNKNYANKDLVFKELTRADYGTGTYVVCNSLPVGVYYTYGGVNLYLNSSLYNVDVPIVIYVNRGAAIENNKNIGSVTTVAWMAPTLDNSNSFGIAETTYTSTGRMSDRFRKFLTSKDLINNLTTDDSSKVLTAAQGKALKDMIDALPTPNVIESTDWSNLWQ